MDNGTVDQDIRVTAYLSMLAPKVSAATQTQALCALVLFHREVLQKPLGHLPEWVTAKRPKRLPEWVTPAEACAIFDRMKGAARIMAELQFGAGLRLREVVSLRIKDVRIEERTLVVRGGKGDKDRVTLLPDSLVTPLREMMVSSRQLWEDDRREGVPGVYLPDDVARKYPGYATRWEWHWVFPSGKLSTDKPSGITRRHHAHPDLLNKAVTVACEKARLGRRVTSHAFRHGFATALLQSGRPIQEVSQLLGHVSIETTQIYLHCLPRLEERITSPLDLARNITPLRRSA
jgi:integron integrase